MGSAPEANSLYILLTLENKNVSGNKTSVLERAFPSVLSYFDLRALLVPLNIIEDSKAHWFVWVVATEIDCISN